MTHVREVKKTALVIITSDKGLAGGLNSGVIKAAVRASEGGPVQSISVYAYGHKGEEYFARRNYTITKSFENKRDDVPLSVMQELSSELSLGFLAGDMTK